MSDPVGPYTGPPPTAPPAYGYGPPGSGAPGYGPPPAYGWAPPAYGWAPPAYGWPAPWGPPVPPAPRRPGQVTGAAVLSFVQFGLALLGTLYLFFVALVAGAVAGLPDAQLPAGVDGLVVEGFALAAVQLAAEVVLLVAAVRALRRRGPGPWRLLVAALAAHVVLAGYWFVRLRVLDGRLPGDSAGALAGLSTWSLLFAAVPLVALGLLLVGPGRRWAAAPAPGGPAPA
jgi:hypothetical protein